MNDVALSPPFSLDAHARRALESSARLWFLTAVAGQCLFAAHVAVYYGGAALRGDLAHWNLVLPHGYVEGETFGNAVVAAHLLLALLLLVAGPLQFVTALRERLPALHRWTGRVYVVTAMSTALVGLYMLLTRGSVGDLPQHVATCFNALLIVMFGALAWGSAVARDFAAHRRWALRLFLAVGGVWFFRVAFMAWVGYNGAPVGFDPRTFTGPFLTFLAFAQTLLPLAVLELYFRAQSGPGSVARVATAGLIAALTVAMGFGVFVAMHVMWVPRI